MKIITDLIIFPNENRLKKMKQICQNMQRKYPDITHSTINAGRLAAYLLPNIEVYYRDTYLYHPQLHTKAQLKAYLDDHPNAYCYDVDSGAHVDLLKMMEMQALPVDQNDFAQSAFDRYAEFRTDLAENEWFAERLMMHDKGQQAIHSYDNLHYDRDCVEKVVLVTPNKIVEAIKDFRKQLVDAFPHELSFPRNQKQQDIIYRMVFPMYRFMLACYNEKDNPVLIIPKALETSNPGKPIEQLIPAFLDLIQKSYRFELFDGSLQTLDAQQGFADLLKHAQGDDKPALPVSFDEQANDRTEYHLVNQDKHKQVMNYYLDLFIA